MKLRIASGWFLLMTMLGPTGASALPEPSSPDVLTLRVKLSAPGYASLTENEIRSAVSGKALILDASMTLPPGFALDVVMVGGCAPVEKFYPDGRWERGICARAYKVDRGHWSVKTVLFGSLLCTVLDGLEADCRAVWQMSSSDRLILTVNPRKYDHNFEYNPYRTKLL